MLQARPPVPEDRARIDQELGVIQQRIEKCAKKIDLDELTQCFIASGSEGVADYVSRKKASLSSPVAAPLPLAPSREFAAKQYQMAHVKLISGEALRRPVTNAPGRPARPSGRGFRPEELDNA
jgi:hypothetical protein